MGARLVAGEQIVHEFPVLCLDGRTRPMRISSSPLRRDGRVVGIVGVHIPMEDASRPLGRVPAEIGLHVAYEDAARAQPRVGSYTHAHRPGQALALCLMPIMAGVGAWPPTQGALCPDCQQAARAETTATSDRA